MVKLERIQELFLEGLTSYDKFFSKQTMEYFKSLLMLEVSILKKELSDEQLEMIMTQRLFRDIVKYNLVKQTKNIYQAKSKELGLENKLYLIEKPSDCNRNIYMDSMDIVLNNLEYNFNNDELNQFSLLRYSKNLDLPRSENLEITLFDFIDSIDEKTPNNIEFQSKMQKIFAEEFETKMDFEGYDMELPDVNNKEVKILSKVYLPLNISIQKLVSRKNKIM